MKILWFTWKDRKHPRAGGAEMMNEEIAKRLVKQGDEVVFIVAGFSGAPHEESVDGFRIIRVGHRWSVYVQAYRFYKKHLEGWADVVIDEINTVPFFCGFYAKEPTILFIHQLCREIWFYELFFPLNVIGYLIEPVYLKMLARFPVITVSQSTKKDLLRFEFAPPHISIIHEGIAMQPVADLSSIQKYAEPTLLSVGALRSMKRTIDLIRAFEIAKRQLPNLQLIVAGKSETSYGKKVLRAISSSSCTSDISFFGTVTDEQKKILMQKAHVLLVASVKEGWGLVVTEANSQGTPAIVYNVDGLRDSVIHGKTGLVTERNTPQSMAKSICYLLNDHELYERLRQNAWQESRLMSFDRNATEIRSTLYRSLA